MIKNDFCVDVTDRELDTENLHCHLNRLLSLCSESNGLTFDSIDFIFSKEFILFMDYLERMEYIPALILLRGHLTEDMYLLIHKLCKLEFFANTRYFSGNTDYSLSRSFELLNTDTFNINLNDKIYMLKNISIIDNLNELSEQAKLQDISYSDACYYAIISYAISLNR